ncbi:MAG: hypothetical protein HFJ79_01700 [Clostridiales bacterium]|jgi:hypothetical protein|nr:hypothetical protein [Clostridiales bacterium]
MSLILDLLALVLIIGVALSRLNRSVLSSAFTLLSAALALTGAFFLSLPAGSALSTYVVAPLAENAAAGELADMVSAPHKGSGRETVKDLPLGDMAQAWAAPFERLCGQYGASQAEVAAAAPQGPEAVLTAITGGFSAAMSRSVSMAVLFVVLLLVIRMLLRRLVEQNLPPPPPLTAPRRLASALLGGAAGLVVLFMVITALSVFLPRSPSDSLLFSADLIEKTDLCRMLNLANPFRLLL